MFICDDTQWYKIIHDPDYSTKESQSVIHCAVLFRAQCHNINVAHPISGYICHCTNALCCIVQAIDSMSTFLHAPLLVSWCATRTGDYIRLVLWCVVMTEKFMQSRKNPNNIFQKITPTFFGSGIPDCSQNGYRRADWIYFMLQ